MAQQVSDFIVQRLHDWGIDRVYGYPGDGINGLMGAMREAEGTDHAVRLIQARHEELAAFMACAHAKFTGKLGVCMATSGPGAVHLLNGLYDAKKDNMPVFAIVGQKDRMSIGTDYQQEIDLISLYKDVANHYVHMAQSPTQIRQLMDRAMRIAIAEREVTCVIVPADVQNLEYQDPPRSHGCTYTGIGYEHPATVPSDSQLDRAAEILNAGEKVTMLVGAGALGATEEVEKTAEALGAGVAKALLGKAAIDDDAAYCTGSIGLLGTEPSAYMMDNCDTVLIVGSSFPYSEWLPAPQQAKGVQIDIKPRKLSLRFPVHEPLHGDAKATLEALLPRLKRKEDRDWRDTLEEKIRDWWGLMEERAH